MTPQQIWQTQSAGAPPVTLEYVRYRAANLSKSTKSMHWRVLVIGTLVSLQFVWNFFHRYAEMPVRQAAGIYIYLVFWFNVVHWFGRTKPHAMPDDAGVTGSLEFYRRELERRRDAAKGTFFRYLVLPLPGIAGLLFSLVLEREPPLRGVVGVMAVFFVLLYGFVAYGRRQQRRRFQKEIDAVNLLLGKP